MSLSSARVDSEVSRLSPYLYNARSLVPRDVAREILQLAANPNTLIQTHRSIKIS